MHCWQLHAARARPHAAGGTLNAHPRAPAPAQESPAANKIKEAFFSEKGLAGNVQKLPLEKVFELESVKKVRAVAAAAAAPRVRSRPRPPAQRGRAAPHP